MMIMINPYINLHSKIHKQVIYESLVKLDILGFFIESHTRFSTLTKPVT